MSALEETLMTDKEFCDKMRIDRATSLRWRDDGKIGFIKLPNGQIRYYASEVEAMLLKNRTEAKGQKAA